MEQSDYQLEANFCVWKTQIKYLPQLQAQSWLHVMVSQSRYVLLKSDTALDDLQVKWKQETCHALVDFGKCNMKELFWIVFIVVLNLNYSNASIWIKNVKQYGPEAATVGVKCLSLMSTFYFKDKSVSRSKTMVVAYTKNLTIPADNIQRLYLKWVHQAIAHNELDE